MNELMEASVFQNLIDCFVGTILRDVQQFGINKSLNHLFNHCKMDWGNESFQLVNESWANGNDPLMERSGKDSLPSLINKPFDWLNQWWNHWIELQLPVALIKWWADIELTGAILGFSFVFTLCGAGRSAVSSSGPSTSKRSSPSGRVSTSVSSTAMSSRPFKIETFSSCFRPTSKEPTSPYPSLTA